MRREVEGTVLFWVGGRERGFPGTIVAAVGARLVVVEIVRVGFLGTGSRERFVRLLTRDGSTFEDEGEPPRVVRVVRVGTARVLEGAGGGPIA